MRVFVMKNFFILRNNLIIFFNTSKDFIDTTVSLKRYKRRLHLN